MNFASAAEYVDCVEVTRAGLISYSATNPQYEIRVVNNCKLDLDTVYLEFDTGSYTSYVYTPRISIWNLTDWATSKTVYLNGIKPGYFSPTVKITVSNDYSWKRVRLPSFTILGTSSPGESGGYVPKNVVTPTPIPTPTLNITKCDYIESTEMTTSLSESISLIEKIKEISSGYNNEIDVLKEKAQKLKTDAQKQVCVTGGADIDSKLNLAKVSLLADVVARSKSLIVEMTNLVLVIQKVPTKPKTVITCVKGKLSKKVSAINPKCPTGYKLKA